MFANVMTMVRPLWLNLANREIRARTAVCPINATMLTVRRECERYTMQQASAWALPAVGNRSGTGKEEVGTKEAIDEVLSDL
jgi:hypothetical protein